MSGECPTRGRLGHDWSYWADGQACRACGLTSTSGNDPCYIGHDWSCSADGQTCRRCGLRISEAQRQADIYRGVNTSGYRGVKR